MKLYAICFESSLQRIDVRACKVVSECGSSAGCLAGYGARRYNTRYVPHRIGSGNIASGGEQIADFRAVQCTKRNLVCWTAFRPVSGHSHTVRQSFMILGNIHSTDSCDAAGHSDKRNCGHGNWYQVRIFLFLCKDIVKHFAVSGLHSAA